MCFVLIRSIRGQGCVFSIQGGACRDFVGVEIGGADPEVQGRVSAGIDKHSAAFSIFRFW